MKKNRVIAAATATLLGIGSISTGVWAADSYVETEKAWLADAVTDFAEAYGEGVDNYKEKNTGKVDFIFELGDAGRALAGPALQTDLSWFKDITISDNVTIDNGKQAQIMDVLMNGNKICTAELYIDTETNDTYVRVPELSDAYLKVNQTDLLQEDLDESDVEKFNVMSDPTKLLPPAEDMKTMMERYGNIILDNIQDDGAAADTLEADGVTQEATLLTGVIGSDEAVVMIGEMLAAAKEDEQLHALIDTWGEASGEFDYDDFIEAIEELQEDLKDPGELDDSSKVTSKIWVDDEDKFLGRQLVIENEGDEEPSGFAFWTTKNGDDRGLYLEFGSDGEYFSLEGSGTLNGDLLTGNYYISQNGERMAAFEVKDYDTAAMEDGVLKGTYSFDLGSLDSEGTFTGFKFSAIFDGEREDDQNIILDLSVSDVSLATLTMNGGEGQETDIPDPATFTTVYDANSDADMEAYTNGINTDTIVANLQAAGMTQEFIDQMAGLINGSTEE